MGSTSLFWQLWLGWLPLWQEQELEYLVLKQSFYLQLFFSYTVSPVFITYMTNLHLHLQVPLSLHSWVWPLGTSLVGLLSTINLWCTVLGGTMSGNTCGFILQENQVTVWRALMPCIQASLLIGSTDVLRRTSLLMVRTLPSKYSTGLQDHGWICSGKSLVWS